MMHAEDERPLTPQQYLDDMVEARGYVLPYHQGMAANDFDVLTAADGLVRAAYLKPRRLSRVTKELLFVLSLTVMRAPRQQLAGHIRVALDCGAHPLEILEAMEIALPEAGAVAFQEGFATWVEVVGAEVMEPSPEAIERFRAAAAAEAATAGVARGEPATTARHA